MKIKLQVLCAAFLLGAFSLMSQNSLPNRGCGTDIPSQQFENWVQGLAQSQGKFGGGQIQSVFNIPVIVHVIHNNEPVNSATATTGGNLNAAQIIDQINILNKDFNGTNPDTILIPTAFKPVQGKFQFNFCLAVVNPTGGVLAEPGIDRINRNTMSWTAPPYSQTYIDATIKPNSIWNPSKYLNMWVCGISGSILGYATFPSAGTSGLPGTGASSSSLTTDGLVMRNNAFGSIGTAVAGAPYNLGRTTTHEIGHWVGLRHIWGDNGQCGATDYCNDTPPAMGGTATPAGCNYGCPTFPFHANTCTISGISNPNGDMFMNYMDYTNDACMYMFTKDQKYRAQLIMTHSPLRASLLTSTVCNLPTAVNDIGILYVSNPTYSQTLNCTNTISPSFVMHNFATNTISSATFTYNMDGGSTTTFTWTGTLAPSASLSVFIPSFSNLSNGSHTLYVGVFNPNGTSDPNMLNNANNQVFSVSMPTLSITGNTAICQGGVATLTAGGASSYTWALPVTTGSTASFSPTVSTIYALAGATGTCTVSKNFTVVVTGSPTICANSRSVCNGAIATLSTCGAASYTLFPGNIPGSNFTVNPSSTANYTIVGTNTLGCTGSAIQTVVVMPLPVVNVTVSPPTGICSGGSATLFPGGACTYSYSGGSSIVSPTVTTTYSVTGISCAGCVSSQTVSVPVTASTLVLTISPSSPSVCAGGSVVLNANGASSYTWNPSGSNATGITVNPTTSVTYSLTGANGACKSNTTISIAAVPYPSVTVNNQTICPGGSATLAASGASGYLWNTGSTSSSITVSPVSNTSYTVTGSNSNCSVTKTVNVTIGAGLSILANTSATAVCAGHSATLSAAGASSYSWSTGALSASIVVNPTVNSNYAVTGLAGSCTGTTSVSVAVVAKPQLGFSVSPSATLCSASTPVTITASGATSYSWSTGGTGNSIVVSPSINTTYSVSGFGTCQADSLVSIYLGVAPPFTLTASPSQTVCPGQSVVLTASGPYTVFAWSNPASTSHSVLVTPSVSTNYTVNASGSGCSTNSVIAITVSTSGPLSTVSTTNAGCGINCSGAVNVITTGGTGPYSYSLAGTSCTSLPCTNLCPGLYTMHTLDAAGCSSFKIFSIQSSGNNLNSIISSTNASCGTCTDGAINVNVSGGATPYTYAWLPGGGNAATASALAIGCYTVFINDAAGCNTSAMACISSLVGLEQNTPDVALLLIYPNPASGEFTIYYPGAIFDYNIMNSLGQLVSSGRNKQQASTIAVENYAKGIYVVEVKIGDQKLRKKLVIE